MSINNLRIIFDRETAVYSPGQTITGRIVFTSSSSMEIRSILMKFKGEANNSWTVYVAHQQHATLVGTYHRGAKYSANEVVFEKINILVNSADKLRIKPGENVYPFNFSLPDLLPSTFHDEYGHVKYTAKVTIDKPRGKDESTEIHFKVFSPFDLNSEPSLAEPRIEEKLKYFSYLFFTSGKIKIVVRAPYTGFIPGQIIPLTIELVNESNEAIQTVQVKLEKNLTFKASEPQLNTKSRSSVHELLSFQGIEGRTSRIWMKEITIPTHLEVNNFKYCGIIDETFTIIVEAKGTGMHTNTEVNMKITMGNIPLTISQASI